MRWTSGRRSTNVEDARGRGPGLAVGGGLGTVVIALLVMLLGGDPGAVIGGGGGATAPTQGDPAGPSTPATDSMGAFVEMTLQDTEDTWNSLFRAKYGADYPEPRLVLFSSAINTACGFANAAVGPFYCPLDRKVYIDLTFYEQLRRELGAPGDFAQAYVIAHEVGHHIQTVTGISEQVSRRMQQAGEAEANELSVRQELQADCFAGVWAHHIRNSQNVQLEPGDVEEGLRAAAAIGDDRLQAQQRGYVQPESFTHGSSEQRVRWLRRGIESGDPDSCDTFNTRQL
jgi:uncharacterized protein